MAVIAQMEAASSGVTVLGPGDLDRRHERCIPRLLTVPTHSQVNGGTLSTCAASMGAACDSRTGTLNCVAACLQSAGQLQLQFTGQVSIACLRVKFGASHPSGPCLHSCVPGSTDDNGIAAVPDTHAVLAHA